MASEFVYTRRVEFADTDTANLIHFTALLKFMEEAEHALYRSFDLVGFRWSAESVFGMPRVSVSCDYLGAVHYGDEVDVRLRVRDVRRKAIRYAAEFTVHRSGKREVVARSDWTVVCARREHGSRDWRGIEIPPPLKERLRAVSPSRNRTSRAG